MILFAAMTASASNMLARPIGTARFINALFLHFNQGLVRWLAAAQLSLAVWLLLGWRRDIAAFIVASVYAVLAGVFAHVARTHVVLLEWNPFGFGDDSFAQSAWFPVLYCALAALGACVLCARPSRRGQRHGLRRDAGLEAYR